MSIFADPVADPPRASSEYVQLRSDSNLFEDETSEPEDSDEEYIPSKQDNDQWLIDQREDLPVLVNPSIDKANWKNTHCEEVRCNDCGSKMNDFAEFERHLMVSHTYSNRIVDARRIARDEMKRSGQKPFKCSVVVNGLQCEFRTSSPGPLIKHINTDHYGGKEIVFIPKNAR